MWHAYVKKIEFYMVLFSKCKLDDVYYLMSYNHLKYIRKPPNHAINTIK